jgi:hypothetical protein
VGFVVLVVAKKFKMIEPGDGPVWTKLKTVSC